MIGGFPLAGIILGLLALIFLLLKRRKEAKLEEGVVVLLAASGIAGGIKVFVLGVTLNQTQLDFVQIERMYLIIGGVAIVWVSVQAILQRIRRP